MKIKFGDKEIGSDFIIPPPLWETPPEIDLNNALDDGIYGVVYFDKAAHYLLWYQFVKLKNNETVDNAEVLGYVVPFSYLEEKEKIKPREFVIALIPLKEKPEIVESVGRLDRDKRSNFLPTELIESVNFFTVFLPRYWYVKKQKLGEGSTGIVYKAKTIDAKDDRVFAIKYVNKDPITPKGIRLAKADVDKIIQNALREITILSLIPPHKNILTMVDSGYDEFGTFLVTTYIRGSIEMEEFILSHPNLPAKAKVNIMLEITDAVRHLHRYQIAHVDLKETNILLVEETLSPILIDFNLSCLLRPGDKYSCSGQKGTLLYMDPRLVLHGDVLPPERYYQADVFSLGVIFYRMITGDYPFYRGDDKHEFKIALSRGVIIPFSSYIPGLDILVVQMLTMRNRPTAEEVYETLTVIYQGLS